MALSSVCNACCSRVCMPRPTHRSLYGQRAALDHVHEGGSQKGREDTTDLPNKDDGHIMLVVATGTACPRGFQMVTMPAAICTPESCRVCDLITTLALQIFSAYQLCEEVCGLRNHPAVHAKALYVLQVGGQLCWVGVDDNIDQDRQEVISTCQHCSQIQHRLQCMARCWCKMMAGRRSV